MNVERMKAKFAGCLKSTVFWFNSVFIALMSALDQWPTIFAGIPALQEFMDATSYRKLMFAALVINLLLRFRTKKPLEAK